MASVSFGAARRGAWNISPQLLRSAFRVSGMPVVPVFSDLSKFLDRVAMNSLLCFAPRRLPLALCLCAWMLVGPALAQQALTPVELAIQKEKAAAAKADSERRGRDAAEKKAREEKSLREASEAKARDEQQQREASDRRVLELERKLQSQEASKSLPCADTQSKDGYWKCRWASFRNPGESCEVGIQRVLGLATSGNAEAMVYLAQRYQPGDADDGGACLVKAATSSLSWWQRAADAGDHYARCEMAKRLLSKSVVEAAQALGRIGKCMNVSNLGLDYYQAGDYESARLVAGVAVKDGDRQGMNLLAMLYERGLGGLSVDAMKARELFRQSAELQHLDGMHNYGIALLVGMGGPVDRTEALVWIERAASQGHPSAPKTLLKMRTEGRH